MKRDLHDLLVACAQDLREYADAAEEAGQSIAATEELLAEVDAAILEDLGLAPPVPGGFEAWLKDRRVVDVEEFCHNALSMSAS